MQAYVLIVEDEKEISDLIALYLENDGITSIQCGSAEEAMKQVEDGREIHLVVLDINLPGMDGFEFLSWLRRGAASGRDMSVRDIPVVIVSAKSLPSDIKVGLEAGAAVYLTKPVSFMDLKEAVQGVIE